MWNLYPNLVSTIRVSILYLENCAKYTTMKIHEIIIEHGEPVVGDIVQMECGDTLVETTIAEVTSDGVVLHLDETGLRILVNGARQLQEGKIGLWDRIHAKRERIKHGSGERMRKPGSKGAPTEKALKAAQAGSKNESAVDEAKYQGREVPLGKPMAGDVAKSKVYVKNAKGNVVKVNFGQKGVKIKKNNPGRRKNFRARHNCDNPGPRTSARYWSCKMW